MPSWKNGFASDAGERPTILLARMPKRRWSGLTANFPLPPLPERLDAASADTSSDCFFFFNTRPAFTP